MSFYQPPGTYAPPPSYNDPNPYAMQSVAPAMYAPADPYAMQPQMPPQMPPQMQMLNPPTPSKLPLIVGMSLFLLGLVVLVIMAFIKKGKDNDKAAQDAAAAAAAQAAKDAATAKAAAATAAAAAAASPSKANGMASDINYASILKAYTPSSGFGNNRNTAIVIVGNFMVANGLFGNPQVLADSDLYNILTASDDATAVKLISASVPATIMQMDPNYKSIIAGYSSTNGFGNDRNTAILIVGNFMAANKISGNPQGYSDAQLYSILTATSPNNAKAMLQGS